MSEVSDYSALLYYLDNDAARWNGQASLGTQVVVTYSFVETPDLAPVSEDPYGANAYWSFSEEQRGNFRQITGDFEAAAAIRFVEVDGPAMINVFGFDGGSAGGWADLSYSTSTYTSQGGLAIGASDMSPGSYGYETVMHELGHALGLKHPHDGDLTLTDSLDTQENTVMTYSYAGYSVSDLGPLDVQALQHIYGEASAFDGWSVELTDAGKVQIRATTGDDVILGTDQDTIIFGRGGNDEFIGREANDIMRAGGGQDTIAGGLGHDKLIGGGGSDLLYGGTDESGYSGSSGERDILIGGGGDDQLFGGHGDDVLKGGRGADRIAGGEGSDVLVGGGGADVFVFDYSDIYATETIRDFNQGDDLIDLTGIEAGSFDQLTITQSGGNTTVSYYGWLEVELSGFTETLEAGDFIFV